MMVVGPDSEFVVERIANDACVPFAFPALARRHVDAIESPGIHNRFLNV